jgi:hypothetical protein
MNLIVFQDKLYYVKRTVLESKLRPDFNNDTFRQWTRTDIILRKDGIIYACELIADAVIESETSENFFGE